MTHLARLYFPVRFAVVAAALSFIVFFLAVPGWANAWTLVPLSLAALFFVRPFAIDAPPRWTVPVLAAYLPLYLFYALRTETQSDALHYHLNIATHNGFPAGVAFYHLIPQGVELLFAAAYTFG
ncbi:MAG: hypothetical protein JNK48_03675, partial [Bryobacterales bacterium]|nr:hypothetical protein [Bryobacterales bacterium]